MLEDRRGGRAGYGCSSSIKCSTSDLGAAASVARPPLGNRRHGIRPAARAKFDTSIEAVSKAMRKSRKRLITNSSEDDYRWAVRNLDVARQLAKCLAITPPPGAGMAVWV